MKRLGAVRGESYVETHPSVISRVWSLRRNVRGVLPIRALWFCGALSLPAFAQTGVGLVGGVTRDSISGKPLAEVQVTAHNLNQGTDRATVTNADGIFVFTNLQPGLYEFAASKNGFEKSSARAQVGSVEVARVELPLRSDIPRKVETPDAQPLTQREKEMLNRIERLEARLAALEGTSISKDSGAAPRLPKSPSGDEALLASATPVAAPISNPLPAQAPAPAPQVPPAQPPSPAEPFAFGDSTWLTGNARTTESPMDTKLFTPEIRADVDYVYDYNHPADHTIGGSSEVFRAGEVQVTQLGVGGDFHWENVRARLMTQFGMYAETTPRNDASPGVGAWDLTTAYRYISEAYGGYHFNALHGINVDAGIFMSYIGLFSYYQFDNWAYQPSYVSSNTPWFFNGVRVQIFPTEKLKIEPWFVNGWQSYGKFNKAPGMGMQFLYRPNTWLSIVGNQYEGDDTLGIPGRHRVHTDDSVQIKYYDNPKHLLDKAAMTLTVDAGCEFGQNSGVSCRGGTAAKPSQYFLGFMAYERAWFHHDLFGVTIGGGAINNPGRYLVLLPPINGATAFTGSPYFPESPGLPFKAWDSSATFDYMPKQYITWRFEYNHRASNVPYFTGPGGITPPGGVNGSPGTIVPGWTPDLSKRENRVIIALLVKF